MATRVARLGALALAAIALQPAASTAAVHGSQHCGHGAAFVRPSGAGIVSPGLRAPRTCRQASPRAALAQSLPHTARGSRGSWRAPVAECLQWMLTAAVTRGGACARAWPGHLTHSRCDLCRLPRRSLPSTRTAKWSAQAAMGHGD